MNESSRMIPTRLATAIRRDVGPADAASAPLAAAARAQWRAIDTALAAIVGPRGVAALYQRSLSLSSVQYPWLVAATSAPPEADPYEVLQRTLAARPATQAGAATTQLLVDFKALLARLIGSALADRLLVEVWPAPPSGTGAQDSDR